MEINLQVFKMELKMIKSSSARGRTSYRKDKRRKHHHFEAKIFYKDGEVFARTYTGRKKADAFAERQRKSPVVKMARVTQIS